MTKRAKAFKECPKCHFRTWGEQPGVACPKCGAKYKTKAK